MATDFSTKELSSDDLSELLKLLKEYTDKVRDFCREEASQKTAKFLRRIVTLLFAAVFLSGAMYYVIVDLSQGYDFSRNIGLLSGLLGLSSCFLLVVDYLLSKGAAQLRASGGEELVLILMDLTKSASQYYEHSQSRISERFEFTERLSEAEAVLNLYEKQGNKIPKGNLEQVAKAVISHHQPAKVDQSS